MKIRTICPILCPKRRCGMPDYKKMYFDLFRATEAAIGTLIEAQQRCEEMLLEEPEPPLVLLPKQDRRE